MTRKETPAERRRRLLELGDLVDVAETRGQGDAAGYRRPEPRPQLYDRFGQPVDRFWWVVPALFVAAVAGLLILFLVAMAVSPEVFGA